MPAKRIPQLNILTGATSATDDKVVIFDADGNETKAITRQELGKGIVGDLPYTPSGGIAATTVPAAIAELDTEAAKSAALAAAGGAALIGNTPAGTIAATTVQGAINEIVSDLAANSGSSLVGYTQGGTGADDRTVQDKLREFVSVKDFGAVGDGVADDGAAITAALAASNSVFLPVGNYLVSSAITLGDNKSIIGAGFGSILYNTSDNVTLEVSGDNTSVQSLKILGNATPVSTTLGRAAIRIGGSNVTVSNVYVQDVNTSGINVASGSNITVSNFVVKNTNEHGVYISDGDRVTFTNGVIETTGQISATVGQGFRVRQSRDVTVSNVVIRDAGQHGFVLDADNSANKCERILLSNVSAQGDSAGSQMGLRITAAVDSVSVIGCRFAGFYGISIFGNVTEYPQNIFIADTTAIAETNSYPVRVVYGDEIYISSGQYVTGGAVQSIYFESTVGNARIANIGAATVRADNSTTYDVGSFVATDGSASLPVIRSVNDATAGVYFPSTGEVGIVADGQESARFEQRTMFFGNTAATHFGRCYSNRQTDIVNGAFADFPVDTGSTGSFGGIAIIEVQSGTNVQMKTISLVGRAGTGTISSIQDVAVRNSGVASITLAISATSGSSLRVTNGSGSTVNITVTVFQMVAGS